MASVVAQLWRVECVRPGDGGDGLCGVAVAGGIDIGDVWVRIRVPAPGREAVVADQQFGTGKGPYPLEPRLVAGEIFLGKRRPFVGRLRLLADDLVRMREALQAEIADEAALKERKETAEQELGEYRETNAEDVADIAVSAGFDITLDGTLLTKDKTLTDGARSAVRRLHDSLGLTTVMVTHDVDEALVVGSRIALLGSSGRVQQEWTNPSHGVTDSDQTLRDSILAAYRTA